LLSGSIRCDAWGSSCLSPVTVLEPPISPSGLGSFYWRMVLETKIWVLNVVVTNSLLLGLIH
jgi:hypothetical protein